VSRDIEAGLPAPQLRRTIVDRLSKRLGELSSYLFLLCVVFTAIEVVARYGFNSPTIWVHDLVIAVSAYCFIVGGAYALERGDHIRISTLYERLPAGGRRLCDLATALLIIAFLAGLLWAATRQALASIALVETSGRAWDVPVPMVVKSVLALGVLLMLLQALVNLLRALRR
jgi:TRAP-type mannitol/chloroaromatic compound transport system permease small subunit